MGVSISTKLSGQFEILSKNNVMKFEGCGTSYLINVPTFTGNTNDYE